MTETIKPGDRVSWQIDEEPRQFGTVLTWNQVTNEYLVENQEDEQQYDIEARYILREEQ